MVPLGWRSHPRTEGAHPGSSATHKAEPLNLVWTSGQLTTPGNMAVDIMACAYTSMFSTILVTSEAVAEYQ